MNKILIIIFVYMFFTGCGDSIQGSLIKQLKDADKVKIYYFTEGVFKDSSKVIEITSPEEVKKITASISDESVPSYKCGYDGTMEIYSRSKIIFSAEFNLQDDCTHFVFMLKNNLFFKGITGEGKSILTKHKK